MCCIKHKKPLILLLLWMALIFVGSSLPKAELPTTGLLNWIAHKVVHIAEYGVLAYLFWQVLGEKKNRKLLALVFTVLYAIADEYHQTFVLGRFGKLQDVLIDGVGGFVMMIYINITERKKS